ncbi:MAG TPA: ABC transporter permease [Gemmatimonadaceae bacterium]|jgi:putative ABC transport system permease protein
MSDSGWRLFRPFWRPRVRDEVDDEMAFHFAMRIDQFVADGMTRADAERHAREQFGDVGEVRATLVGIDTFRRRRMDLRDKLDAILMDVRFAARSLRAHWGISLTIIGTLAMAIGATTAIFSVVNAVLIRPLPYGDAERLGFVFLDFRIRGVQAGVPLGDIPDVRSGAPGLDIATAEISLYQPFDPPGVTPRAVTSALVTANIFDVLQVPIVLGRNFVADDAKLNAPPRGPSFDTIAVVTPSRPTQIGILGYDFWQQQFHGDSSVIGKTIGVSMVPIQIVGVASPSAVLFTKNGQRTPDVWRVWRTDFTRASKLSGGLTLIARRKPRVSIDAVQRQLDQIGAGLRSRLPLLRSAGAYPRFDPMQAYLVRGVRPAIIALMGAVVFLLLIACANVASLLLVRAAQRERELVVRSAIGGSPWRILRQLLVESVLLSSIAAVVGVTLAAFAVPLLVRLAPSDVPRLTDVSIDRTVLLFALAIAGAVSIVAGTAPAIRVWKPRIAAVLRTSTRITAFGAPTRLRNTMAVTEVALSFVLLIGCGLMVRTFVALTRADLGFEPSGVLTFRLTNRIFRGPADFASFVPRIHDALVAAPGVISATMSMALPLGGSNPSGPLGTTAARTDSTLFREASYRYVLPDYFETMRIPLLAGRTFRNEEDVPGQRVVVIDDETARRSFGHESAIGKTLVARVPTATYQELTVIGVVKHERHTSLVGSEMPAIYFPEAVVTNGGGAWIVRTTGDPMALVPSVRAAIARVNPELFIEEIRPMTSYVDGAMAPTRFALTLIGLFSVIAVFLAAVGLYGVLSSVVRLRTAEIGIRMAFGADRANIFSLIIVHGFRLAAVGLGVGVVLALATTRVMTSLLAGVQPTDPITFATMSVLFLCVVAAACWVPAHRASALDPMIALRED